MSWRLYAERVFLKTKLTDVYQFGVFTGESMYDIINIFNIKDIPIRKFFGFDSFIGLPEETAEPIYQDCWTKGNFNASEKLQANSVEECIQKLDSIIRGKSDCSELQLEWIQGFFEDSLNDDIVKKYDMKPASYVDLDADLYSSTLTALDFMCRNKLIVSGTLLGYDDWGGTPNWVTYGDGESRAHKEICEKYGLNCRLLCQFGNEYPHVQTVFEVI